MPVPQRSRRIPSPARLLARLVALRGRHGVGDAAAKLNLLARLAPRPPAGRSALVRYHDVLLFLRAFPDDAAVHAEAVRQLHAIGRLVRRLPRSARARLDDSGMEATTSRHVFAFDVARCLTRLHADQVDVDWRDGHAEDAMDVLVRPLMSPAEVDALDAGELDARTWITLASRGHARRSALAWTFEAYARARAMDRLAGRYDAARVPLCWNLSRSSSSPSRLAVAGSPVVARAAHGLRRLTGDPRRAIAMPTPGVTLLAPDDAERWADVARASLASRCREVHAINWANPREVYLADLGVGVQLAIFGTPPERRMALEANYGYMLFANGVPLGYGGVTPLFFDANTGINIFDPFRGSESAFVFMAMLRAFRTLFGTTRFVVNPFQFGEGNDEALQSGAFWFYYRLGFRPAGAAQRALADREAARLAGGRRRRSSLEMLRAMATCDLYLVLPGFRPSHAFEERWIGTVATGITRHMAERDERSPSSARRHAEAEVAGTIDVRRGAPVSRELKSGLRTLAPVIDLLLAEAASWPVAERRGLSALVRAKGGPREREFVMLSQRHPRYLRALRAWCLAHEEADAIA